MFWMFVKTTLLALYILAGLGVIVMNLTLRHDLKRYIKKEGIKYEPYSLSEKVASKIRYWISIFCPVWNFIMFLVMAFRTEEIMDKAIDELLDRRIFDKEEE
jgi:uncharacterized membrane protein YcgQ (UPF0703/DUF1980 family)